MLPLLTAAMSIISNKERQAESEKAAKIAAALGQMPQGQGAQKQGSMGGMAGAAGGLSNIFKGLGQGGQSQQPSANGQLDALGFTGQNAPSNEDLLGDY